MSTDPQAQVKEQHYAAATAALLAVYTAARADILKRIPLGHIRDALRSLWVDRYRTNIDEIASKVVADVIPDGIERNTAPYVEAMAKGRAQGFEQAVEDMLDRIDLGAADLLAEAERNTEAMSAVLAESEARDTVNQSAHFAAEEVARAKGKTEKTWHTGPNPRASHLAQDGVTVPIGERFPNGQRFPGSPAPPGEVINCNCHLTFGGGGA